ncbi:neprilysin-2-like [Microplitis mediator]|uniref:neprilysin-2-like n=1 Tax=Microplitis mediator TaxID=375433 RepID=UPI00255242A1|nr:neprilysin-2-like [Microplitis mediator]
MFKLWSIWVAIFSSALFVAGNVTSSENNPSHKGRYNCKTRECFIDNLKFEFDLTKNMNDSVDPCENFYEYACGNFDDLPHAPKTMNRHMEATSIMSQAFSAALKDPKSVNKSKPLNFIANYMTACADLNHNNEYKDLDAKEDKLDFLKEVISKFGGWPVVEGDKWKETDFDWIKFAHKSGSMGYSFGLGFLNFFVNYTNPDSPVSFVLSPPFLEFTAEYSGNPQNNPAKTAYYNYMINVAKFLGADETRAKEDLKEAFEFESKLIAKTAKIENLQVNSMSVEEMERTWPIINWSEYFGNHLHPYFSVENKTLINISDKNYIAEFEKLMNTTSKKAQANYAIWKMIQSSIPYIKSVTLYNFAKTYAFFRQAPDTSLRSCDSEVQTYLSKLILAHFARNNPIAPEVKRSAGQIFSNIKNKLLDILKSNTSQSQFSENIIKKIENVKIVFGYPDELLDDEKLNEYFEALEITKDNYLANWLSSQSFNTRMQYRMVSKSQDAYDWKDILSTMYLHSPVQQSQYFSRGNVIEILSVLSNFYINPNRNNYSNYGGIGAFIGRELVNVLNISMNSSNDYPSDNVDNCDPERYSNYTGRNGTKELNSLMLKIVTTQQLGLEFAYSAYQEWAKEHGEEKKLANLYSPNQLFWLSYVNAYCAPKKPKFTVYVPIDKEVNWQILNTPQFSKDFNCPLGSSMNPKNKCRVL